MFYERHQNFGFPITTTTNAGAIITTVTNSNGMNSSLSGHHPGDPLAKMQADVRSGNVQLDETEFKVSSAGGKMITPDTYNHDFIGEDGKNKKDSLDLVGGKRASQPIIGSQ